MAQRKRTKQAAAPSTPSTRTDWKAIFATIDKADFRDFDQDRDQGEYEKREPLDRQNG